MSDPVTSAEGAVLKHATIAVVCGCASIGGIFAPEIWNVGIAITAFASGLHTAIALLGGRP